jgi:flagellar biosynthesis/type III secretory pathway protein FliH
MSDFCVATITAEPDLRAANGVLRAGSRRITADARVIARQVLQDAHDEAEAVLCRATEQATRATQDAEQDAITRARGLLQALEQAHATLVLRGQDIIVDVAQRLFDQLVMDTAPRERIEATLKRVLEEAPSKLVNPVLRVHPADFDLVPSIDWEVKADPSLTPGTCRLEAATGQWRADFSAAVAALKAAFERGVADAESNSSAAAASGWLAGDPGTPHDVSESTAT